MLLQIVGECFAHSLVYGSHHLVVSEFCFGLPFKLRFGHFDGDYCGQAFAEVITRNLYFGLFQHLVVLGVFLQRTGKRTTETCQVGTAFDCIDIVYVRVDVLVVGSVVHDGHLHRCALFLGVNVDDIVHQMFAGGVDIAHEFFQAFYGVENLLFIVPVFFFYAKVGQRDFDSGVQVSQLTHAGSQNVVVVDRFGENRIIRPELLACTCNFGNADFLYRI